MIPTAALRDSVSVYATTGTTGYGVEALSAVPVVLPAAVAPAKGRINLPSGDTATVEAVAYIRPGTSIGLMSKVIWRAREYRVAGIEVVTDPRGEAMHALSLAGAFGPGGG